MPFGETSEYITEEVKRKYDGIFGTKDALGIEGRKVVMFSPSMKHVSSRITPLTIERLLSTTKRSARCFAGYHNHYNKCYATFMCRWCDEKYNINMYEHLRIYMDMVKPSSDYIKDHDNIIHSLLADLYMYAHSFPSIDSILEHDDVLELVISKITRFIHFAEFTHPINHNVVEAILYYREHYRSWDLDIPLDKESVYDVSDDSHFTHIIDDLCKAYDITKKRDIVALKNYILLHVPLVIKEGGTKLRNFLSTVYNDYIKDKLTKSDDDPSMASLMDFI